MRGMTRLALLVAAMSPAAAQALEYVPDQVICKSALGHTIEEINAYYGTIILEWIPDTRVYLLGTTGIEDIEAYADSMEANTLIEGADANYVAYAPEAARQMPLAAVGGTVGDFEDQDMVDRIDLASAHAVATGKGVTVAVLDTGAEPHPYFNARLLPGFDFVDDDPFPREEPGGLAGEEGDGWGHGTMVAGLVALVAPDAAILPVRVLDGDGVGTTWTAIEGVHYATDQGVDVMNLSFGTPAEIPLLTEELERAYAADIIVVAAAGNQSSGSVPYYPGANATTLMITAVDSLDIKADFADWHALVDASAPGTGIRSTYPGGGWAIGSGCSFATPIVAGEIALLISELPLAPADVVAARMRVAVDDVYALPENAPFAGGLGTGRVDVGQAVSDIVGVETEPVTEGGRVALRARPNPSAGRVHVTLERDVSPGAALHVYSAVGRRLRTLALSGREGVWDGRDAAGRPSAPGVYFLEIVDGTTRMTTAVRLLR